MLKVGIFVYSGVRMDSSANWLHADCCWCTWLFVVFIFFIICVLCVRISLWIKIIATQ